MNPFSVNRRVSLALLLIPLVLAACASDRYHQEGLGLLAAGKPEEGIASLAKAVEEDPTNAEYRKDLYVQREAYVGQLLAIAEAQRNAGKQEDAEATLRKVLVADPANVRARTGLDALTRDRRHADAIAAARAAFKTEDADRALELLRPVLAENSDDEAARSLRREIREWQTRRQSVEPVLHSSHTKPVNIEFRDANVRMVLEALSHSTGINFIIDKDVRPDLRTSVFLKNAAIEDALDLILQTSQLAKKILNSNTVLVYPDTPEKVKEYQDLVVKAFYLKNANAKDAQNTLKTLLKVKDVIVDEKLNLIVMRDTPEAVRLAEKLVALQDLAQPEVMLEVEVLEVQRSRLLNLGIQWPNQLTLTPLPRSGSNLTADDLRNLNGSRLGASVSNAIVNLRQDLGDANLLANPRIRVRNREAAKILVGDKIPVVTTTTTATGLVSDSVQYLDVGLKVELQPDIHLQDDVSIKVGLEVSSLGQQITTPSGTIAYQIGTRTANTVLRLKDGETQILAGLISDQERGSGTGIPGLSRFPILGRLFGSRQDSHDKTEIVLSITPHLIRNLARPDADQGEFWSGSESTLRTKPLSLMPVKLGKDEPASSSDASKATTSTVGVSDEPAGPARNLAITWQGPAHAKVGEQFKLALRVKADGALRSLPFQVGFDPSALQVVAIDEGGFFKQNGGASTFSTNIDAAHGRFFVSAARSDPAGATGEDAVAVITLRALTPKPKTDVTLLAASPIVDGDKTPASPLPAPYSVVIDE